jgi:hypothetical protein
VAESRLQRLDVRHATDRHLPFHRNPEALSQEPVEVVNGNFSANAVAASVVGAAGEPPLDALADAQVLELDAVTEVDALLGESAGLFALGS